MKSRGRRVERRKQERAEYKADQAKRLELQRSFSPTRKRKIKNEKGEGDDAAPKDQDRR